MDCQRARECLSPLADGELPVGLVREVLGHLRQCDSCRRELAALRAIGDGIRSIGATDVPGGLAARVVAAAGTAALVRRSARWPVLHTVGPRLAGLLAGAALVAIAMAPITGLPSPTGREALPLAALVSDAHFDVELHGSFAGDLARLTGHPEGQLLAELVGVAR
ncbi:MAG: zf-HC2 domain-containing protein [Planctomycetota bacterium]